MVKHRGYVILSLALSLSLPGCGFIRSFWGEKAPPRKIVTLKSESMPDFTEIFSSDDEHAISVLNTYRQSLLDTFSKIEGEKKNQISTLEIETIARSGLAKLSDDPNLNIKRIRSVLQLLGFKKGISLDQLVDFLNWIEKNRIKAKAFYDLFINDREEFLLHSENLIQIVQLSGSLIAKGGDESLSREEVAELIRPWIPSHFVHASRALESGIDLTISVFGSLCGDRVDQQKWNAKKNGECLLALMDHFRDTAPVFDLIFNRLDPISERNKLASANAILVERVKSWMKGHQHPPFMTQKVETLAKELQIPTPYHFLKLTEWLPKLNSASTVNAFSPSFFIDIAQVVETWIQTFLRVTADQESSNCSLANWKFCEFKGDYETADRLFNDEYATRLRTNNLGFVYRISFYDSIAEYLLKAFDDNGDGILKDDIKDLITITIRLLDSNAFAMNVINRIQEKPVEVANAENSIKDFYRQGLGEVAALVADLIPDHEGRKRKFIQKITSIVYDGDRMQSYTLDRMGITTFIYVFDLLGELRTKYLETYDFGAQKEGTHIYMKRRRIVELLPQMLYDHFPRIYNECLDWGFERTCGVIYTEVLASAPKGTELLEDTDLDMINLTSVLLESMMNRCDRNLDDKISTNIFDGYDEKHCVLTISSTLAKRLMNAKILENDKMTRTLLGILKWLPPARWASKVALERGTFKGIGLRAVPLVSLVSGPAKLGGIMSLTAEFMDPEKVDAVEAGIMGHHEDSGDELIYLKQMSTQYLPSKAWAPRTSAAARILYGPQSVSQ